MALPARPYDPLYDTTYTVSGARDHYRQQTVAGGFMIEKAPEYPNMFSELPHFPATTFRLKNSDKVPGFVDRTFHAETKDSSSMTLRSRPDMVAGQQRYKYFRRPMLASAQPVLIRQAPVEAIPVPPPLKPEPKSKTIGTQSDYRESEVQTMPWDPEIVLPDTASAKQQYLSQRHNCEGPELLQLKDMKFGDGLPPGLQEVRRIEKLRAKRAFEATLPPINDLEHLPLRQKMIEEWEAKEWDDREDEILGVQDERLGLIDQALQVREEEIEAGSLRRIEDRKVAMLQHKAPQFAAIQANRIKTMRQLIDARKYVEKHRKLVKPTIVERYANFGSTTYAPVQREGRFPETKPQHKTIETEGYQPVTLEGIAELEMFLPVKLLVPKATNPRPTIVKADYKQRQEAAVQRDLQAINQLLDTARTLKGLGFGDCWPAPLKESEAGLVSTAGGGGLAAVATLRANAGNSTHRKSVVRAVERPDTPELPAPSTLTPAGNKEAAAVLLQRLLRGRAAQNIMYEGKMRRMQLIKELQLEHNTTVTFARPEDRHPAAVRLDALLGTMVSQLATALTTQDDALRAQLLSEALASAQAAPNELDASALASVVPRSRVTTPLRAAEVSGAQQPAFAPAPAEEELPQSQPEADSDPVASRLDELDVPQAEAEAAAVRIQAAFKGHMARKDVAAMRALGAESDADMVDTVMAPAQQFDPEEYTQEHVAAVTKIQAVQRGRVARKEVQEKRQDSSASPAAEKQSDEQPPLAPLHSQSQTEDSTSGAEAGPDTEAADAGVPEASNRATDGEQVINHQHALEAMAEVAPATEAASEASVPEVVSTNDAGAATQDLPQPPAEEPAPWEAPASAEPATDLADEAAAATLAPPNEEQDAASQVGGDQDAPATTGDDTTKQPLAEQDSSAFAAEGAISQPEADREAEPTDEAGAEQESASQPEATPADVPTPAGEGAPEPADADADSTSSQPVAEEAALGHEATLGDVGLAGSEAQAAAEEEEEREEAKSALHTEATLGDVGQEEGAEESRSGGNADQVTANADEQQIELLPPTASAQGDGEGGDVPIAEEGAGPAADAADEGTGQATEGALDADAERKSMAIGDEQREGIEAEAPSEGEAAEGLEEPADAEEQALGAEADAGLQAPVEEANEEVAEANE